MKKLAALVFVLFLFVTNSLAQTSTPERIRFQRGRTTAVINGRTDTNGRHYLLRANAGQRMIVHLSSAKKDIHFQVVPARADGEAIESSVQARDWEGDLPETGDYYVSVFANKGAGDFTLEVTIRGAAKARTQTATGCAPFDGTYQTDYGELKLTRNGNNVRGVYSWEGQDNSTVEGVVNGNVLAGRWTQPDGKGRFRFTLGRDGRSFTGSFTTDGAPDANGEWNGTCAGGDRP
ncbi:MAG TPA: hypothetical protein VGW12_08220 [Pyrinomonadaceae bacterium]|nr:hypothetical protein [Pyrinomonadaceae bacterium]